jgi:hypothetical protein
LVLLDNAPNAYAAGNVGAAGLLVSNVASPKAFAAEIDRPVVVVRSVPVKGVVVDEAAETVRVAAPALMTEPTPENPFVLTVILVTAVGENVAITPVETETPPESVTNPPVVPSVKTVADAVNDVAPEIVKVRTAPEVPIVPFAPTCNAAGSVPPAVAQL